MESRYLGVLRKLQENKALEPVQQEAVRKLIEDALKGELKNVVKLQPVGYKHHREHPKYTEDKGWTELQGK